MNKGYAMSMKTFTIGQKITHRNGYFNPTVMSGNIEAITVNGRNVDHYNYNDSNWNEIILSIDNGKWCYPHQVCA